MNSTDTTTAPTSTVPAAAPIEQTLPFGQTPTVEDRTERNMLTFRNRVLVSTWLDTPEMKHRAARETDALIATESTTAHGFTVTAANITSLRRELGIEKIKAVIVLPSTTQLPEGFDLAALFRRLEAIEKNQAAPPPAPALTDPIRAASTEDVIKQLQQRVHDLEITLKLSLTHATLIIPDELSRESEIIPEHMRFVPPTLASTPLPAAA